MGKYDGPSFYKKDHPKVKPMKKDRFRNEYKQTMPKNVRTRDERHNEARNYMETPSSKATSQKYGFRRKYIPTSLQNLEGWQQTKKNDELITAIEKRLAKEKDSYLLFADAMKEPLQPPKAEKTKTKKQKKHHRSKVKRQTKVNAGLHRTLSKIIAEDDAAIKNGKNNLDSLFSEDKE